MIYDRYLKQYATLFQDTDRNMWNYEDGCVLIGLLAMYEATGDAFYFNALSRFTDRYIEDDGTIRKYDMQEYNLDFIPAGRVLFSMYRATGQEKYRTAIETLAEQIRNQPRTHTGSFWHKGIYPYQVWLDGLYMGLPYYMMYENEFGGGLHYRDVLLQFENARKYLYDDKTHLYYHAWCESRDIFWADPETGLSKNFWTRAIGWYVMALADVYDLMPETEAEARRRLAELWKEAIDGLLEWQDKDSNLFYQLTALPDEPGNYLETSGSLMVAYSLLKGARLGVLGDASYRRAGEQILMGIELRQFSVHGAKVSLGGICKGARLGVLGDGSYRRAGEQILMGIELRQFSVHGAKVSLGGICKGAGLGPDGNFRRDGSVKYYLSEDVVEDEQKGVGVCMMAYAEYLRARDAGALAENFPEVEVFNKAYDIILPSDPNFKP